jgi:hypothetical protein
MPLRYLPLLVLLCCLPACAVTLGGKELPESRELERAKPAEAKGGVPFAIARKPGSSKPLNPEPADPPIAKNTDLPEVPAHKVPTESEPKELPLVIAPVPVPEAPLVGILRAYVEGHPEAAMPLIQKLGKPNQELVLQLVPALVRASQLNPAQAEPKELAMVAEQLSGAASMLSKRAPMTIEKAVFCRSVTNFGRYEPFPENPVLKPGTLNTIYFEFGNVPSEPANRNGLEGYLTKLSCSYRVCDSGGAALEIKTRHGEVKLEPIETKLDFTQSPLRDYFLQLNFTAPSKPGAYTVFFKVKDLDNGREVVRTLPFRVP